MTPYANLGIQWAASLHWIKDKLFRKESAEKMYEKNLYGKAKHILDIKKEPYGQAALRDMVEKLRNEDQTGKMSQQERKEFGVG